MNKSQISNLKSQISGFSFIGVIVATSIATIGIMSIFSLANMALKGASSSKMRLIASGLAQEGIEIVRDIRKSNAEWQNWEWYSTTMPMAHPISSQETYCVQYNSAALVSCPDPEVPLKLDASSGLYQYGAGEDTPFYRAVILTRQSDDEVKVNVIIKWEFRGEGTWHYLQAEDRLWKWK